MNTNQKAVNNKVKEVSVTTSESTALPVDPSQLSVSQLLALIAGAKQRESIKVNAITAEIETLRAEIAPINAEIARLLGERATLTGKKAGVKTERVPCTGKLANGATCGTSRHGSNFATCNLYVAKKAAEAAQDAADAVAAAQE